MTPAPASAERDPARPPGARGGWARRLEVVRELALGDFRLKYHDSLLGYLYSMLSPALMLGIFYVVFRYLIVVPVPGYLFYLSVGLVFWTFFQDCSCSGLTALMSKAVLLRSVRVPPLVVVAGSLASTVITLAINSAVLLLALGAGGRLSPLAPLAVLPLLGLLMLAAGVGLLVAVAYVHFRDVPLIWNVLLQALFWLTPVAYHVSSQPLWELVHLNPLARCLTLLRFYLIYDHAPPVRFVALTLAACAAVLGLGVVLFLREQPRIPEAL
jgi:ABC-type polysaccharide/polyol phosphate export permease